MKLFPVLAAALLGFACPAEAQLRLAYVGSSPDAGADAALRGIELYLEGVNKAGGNRLRLIQPSQSRHFPTCRSGP